ncbi:hypothetical protein [Sulfurimonas sp.]|jgi:hypothetical protein|uniref:hypothetical protein n=1 Tax=Sulfurimonas sp. TaxID=2022749 RepID=UPI0025D4F517|nr:hypothetical protein [Sulfurimonas sp.]
MYKYYLSIFVAAIVLLLFIIVEDNFKSKKMISVLIFILTLHSMFPTFIKSEKIGTEWIEGGGTRSNPVEYEGYVDVYKLHFTSFSVGNINYRMTIFNFFILIALLGLHYKIIIIMKREE